MKRSLVFPLLLFFLLVSCAAKVSVLRTHPAKYRVEGVQRIGVVAYADYPVTGERSAAVAEKAAETLRWRNFYKEVRLLPLIKDIPPEKELKKLGGQKGQDALLAINAARYDVETDWGTRRKTRKEKTGRKIIEIYQENGEEKQREVDEMRTVVYEVPYVQKRGTIDFLANFLPMKEEPREKNRYRLAEKLEAEGQEEIQRLPINAIFLQKLSAPLFTQLADNLTPHEVAESLKLASCSGCRTGISLAKQGDWKGAIQAWEGHLERNPDSHQAAYNIGVAHEGQKQYLEAKRSYTQAAAIKNKGKYQKALTRLEQTIETEQHLKKQMQGR